MKLGNAHRRVSAPGPALENQSYEIAHSCNGRCSGRSLEREVNHAVFSFLSLNEGHNLAVPAQESAVADFSNNEGAGLELKSQIDSVKVGSATHNINSYRAGCGHRYRRGRKHNRGIRCSSLRLRV